MTAAISVRLICDGCRNLTPKPMDSAYRSRRYYAALGWKRSNGEDLCPHCRKARGLR